MMAGKPQSAQGALQPYPFTHRFTQPLLAPFLRSRLVCLVLLIAAGVQAGLSFAGLPAWTCPMHQAGGFTCPGCGMTRGVLAWLHGHPAEAFAANPLSLLLLIGLLLALIVTVLTGSARQRVIDAFAVLERRIALMPLFGVLLVLVWGTKASIGFLLN